MLEEPSSSFQKEPNSDQTRESQEDPISRVKADVERLVQGFDFQTITQRVEEYGRENPIGLALGALTVGLAVGAFMRPPKKNTPKILS